ncbi:MAG: hypothetical protein CXT77_02120 [uncultured DHVE6 group euryarchaeote]|jgi:small conductance mechanosensitive channel|nr:MAG: hypothetical protein CXT77_02120 [uncultured DHVE6 group euryarchaeote]
MKDILTLAYKVSLYILATFGSALLIIITGVLLGRILGKLASRTIKKANLNGNLRKALKIKTKPQKIAENFVKYSIIGVAIIAAIIQVGVAISLMNFILIIFGGILLISFTLALRDFMPNIFAGLYLIGTKKIKKGDFIKFKDFDGKVIKIDLLDTYLAMDSKNTMMIPNSYLMKNVVIKHLKDRKPQAK